MENTISFCVKGPLALDRFLVPQQKLVGFLSRFDKDLSSWTRLTIKTKKCQQWNKAEASWSKAKLAVFSVDQQKTLMQLLTLKSAAHLLFHSTANQLWLWCLELDAEVWTNTKLNSHEKHLQQVLSRCSFCSTWRCAEPHWKCPDFGQRSRQKNLQEAEAQR